MGAVAEPGKHLKYGVEIRVDFNAMTNKLQEIEVGYLFRKENDADGGAARAEASRSTSSPRWACAASKSS